MKIKVHKSIIEGTIKVPSSKSEIHRALICAALSKNQQSKILNVDLNDDINATIKALINLGAKIEYNNNALTVFGFNYETKKIITFNSFDSGSSLRFLIPLCSYFSNKLLIKGSETLLKRPLDIYKDILKNNMIIEKDKITINNTFNAGIYKIKGDISSQFITGLLFLLPILKSDSIIEITSPLESKPYVNMTINVLSKYGIRIDFVDNKLFIKGRQRYIANEFIVENDYSSASNILSLGLLSNKVICKNLNPFSLQSDKEFINIVKRMNGNIEFDYDSILALKSELTGTVIDLSQCPDLGPILIVLGCLSNSPTHIKNTYRLSYKESNRAYAMKEELEKIGINIKVDANDIFINPPFTINKTNEIINPRNDHRIFMAFMVLGLTQEIDLIIDNPRCVNKSYPKFLDDIISIGGKIEFID